MTEYVKTVENGKVVYRYLDGQEVPVYEWNLDEFINYCLFPIQSFIHIIDGDGTDEMDVMRRLYDAAMLKLREMARVIDTEMGRIQIIQENHPINCGFVEEEILGAYIEQKKIEPVSNSEAA
jgi:hypothetical protein